MIDCMFFDDDSRPNQIVRLVEGKSGTVPMRMELVLRFDYGSRVPWVTSEEDCLSAIAGAEVVRLYTDVPTRGEDLKNPGRLRSQEGRARLVHDHARSFARAGAAAGAGRRGRDDHRSALARLSDMSTYSGHYKDAVQRSLLTLKALTYRPTGGIVAAPTTSAAGAAGRHAQLGLSLCWLRDATISLYALWSRLRRRGGRVA